jgi:cytochrome c-type biogenesis protein CcmH
VKSLALPVALAALLALAALVALEALGPAAPSTRAEQARQIAADLRCPDCLGLSVAESQTAAAVAIRRQIVDLLSAGQTPNQVRDYFVARYGEWILLRPTSPLAWWLPPAVVLLGAGLLGWWLWRARPAAEPRPASPAPGMRDRIRDEVEKLDA